MPRLVFGYVEYGIIQKMLSLPSENIIIPQKEPLQSIKWYSRVIRQLDRMADDITA